MAEFTLLRLFPNFVTILGLVIGLNGLRFALDSKWETAVASVFFAAIIDGIDGKIARFLNATSIFGAELDSLCDLVNFGIVPGMIVYLWSNQDSKTQIFVWSAVLFFIVCMAIRLARFNIHLMQDRKKLQGFFIGIPAPASALLLLIPIMLSFEMSEKISIYFFVCYTFLIGIGAASRIPTFSLKNFSIHQEYVWVYMVIFALLTVLLILSPWIFIPVLGLAYILSIPASYLMFKKNYEK